MKRAWKVVLWILGILVALVAAAVIFLATFDWNRLKPYVDRRVTQAIGREFRIRGDVTVDWQWNPGKGWLHALLPWPEFTVRDVTIGNPDWAKRPRFAQLDAARFEISPWGLLHKTVTIPDLRLDHPELDIERSDSGKVNWHFGGNRPSSGGSGWDFNLEGIGFDQGTLHLRDAPTRIVLDMQVRPLARPQAYGQVVADTVQSARKEIRERFAKALPEEKSQAGQAGEPAGKVQAGHPTASTRFQLGWDISGTYRDAPVHGSGMTGGFLALRDSQRPLPLQVDMRAGQNRLALIGTLSEPLDLGTLDVRMWLAGNSMGDLYPTTGINLPATPPYATEGSLTAKLNQGRKGVFAYRDFFGRVGGSDLRGSLTFDASGQQPKLDGKVHSDQLRMQDLGTLVGKGSSGAEAAKAQETQKPPGQVLPVSTFNTDRWQAMDADVQVQADRIVDQPLPPVQDLQTHVTLKNGMLQLSPLRMRLASGGIGGTITLDGSQDPMPGALTLDIRHIKLQQLFPTVDAMKGSLGEINGDIDLHMQGNSVAALLGSADGEVKALMDNGAISRLLLEEAGLNLGHVAMEKLFGSKDVQINCAAVDMPADNGVFKAQLFVLDTPDATVRVDGTVNMASERFDLTVHPNTKGPRFLSLRTPITVGGTFRKPDVGIEKGPLVARAAGAVALGAVAAPAAALLALIAPGKDQDHNTCRQVLHRLHDPDAVKAAQ